MEKRGSWALWVSIALVVVLVAALFFYFALFNPGNESFYAAQEKEGKIVNPALNLSMEQAISQFNESFVWYVLYNLKAYNLHSPPLSSDNPKIQFVVGEESYRAVVNRGIIIVEKGESENRDIIIRTSKEEAVMMIKNNLYVEKSFREGKSSIELISSKSSLFAKGYLNLYNELTGKSVTGNVVRIYIK